MSKKVEKNYKKLLTSWNQNDNISFVGASRSGQQPRAAKIVSQRMKTKKRVSITYTQAKNFLDTYRDILPDEARKCLEIYTDIPNHNKLGRIYLLIKHGFLKQNFLTAAGQLVFC